MKRLLAVALLVLLSGVAARAEVKTRTVEYKHDEVTLKGYLAWDDAIQGKRPGVLVVHEWWGLNDYARKRARQLAEMGYVAFAVDMYGEGKVTTHPKEANKWAAMIKQNEKKWVERAQVGLKVLTDHELVDDSRLAAIGYCFGGSTVLQLAYNGADLDAVASFHGALPVPDEKQAKSIKGKVLICHGAADSFISEEVIQKVRAALEKADVDYHMIYYGGARHSFTVPEAAKAGVEGIQYDEDADRRSWQHLRILFAEVFGEKK